MSCPSDNASEQVLIWKPQRSQNLYNQPERAYAQTTYDIRQTAQGWVDLTRLKSNLLVAVDVTIGLDEKTDVADLPISPKKATAGLAMHNDNAKTSCRATCKDLHECRLHILDASEGGNSSPGDVA